MTKKYKKYKNRLTKTLRNCVKSYYSNLLSKYQNNIKETWNVLNRIIIDDIDQHLKIPPSFVCKGRVVDYIHTIVNEFNYFFVDIDSDLAKKIPVVDNISLDSFLEKNNCNSLFLTPIAEK